MTPAEFKAYFTEFSATDDAIVQRAIDIAELTIDAGIYGTSYELAIKYLTAHYVVFSTSQSGGSAKSIKSVSSRAVDGVSVSYGAPASGESDYNATSYGQAFKAISVGYGSGGFTC